MIRTYMYLEYLNKHYMTVFVVHNCFRSLWKGGFILVLLFYHVPFCLVPVTESLQFVVAVLLQSV